MAKFSRFDSRNKKKGKHKAFVRDNGKDFRIKDPAYKSKLKFDQHEMRKQYDNIDSRENL
jgi:hypothetical protein